MMNPVGIHSHGNTCLNNPSKSFGMPMPPLWRPGVQCIMPLGFKREHKCVSTPLYPHLDNLAPSLWVAIERAASRHVDGIFVLGEGDRGGMVEYG